MLTTYNKLDWGSPKKATSWCAVNETPVKVAEWYSHSTTFGLGRKHISDR